MSIEDDFPELPKDIYITGITYISDEPDVLEFKPPARPPAEPPDEPKPAPEQP